MNFLLAGVFIQFLGFIFAHNFHSFDVKVINSSNFESEVMKSEVMSKFLFFAYFVLDACYVEVLRPLVWSLQENGLSL